LFILKVVFIQSCFYFSVVLFGIFFVLVYFHPIYFLIANKGAFVYDVLGEYTFEDSDDWDKNRFFLALVEFEG
jgi:hypothetical protein